MRFTGGSIASRLARLALAAAVAFLLLGAFLCRLFALSASLAFATLWTRLARFAHLRLLRLDGAGIEAHQIAFRDALLGHALDALEQLFLVRRDQRNGFTAAPGTASTADAVYVVFLDVGQLEVDHMGQLVDIQTAGGDIGGDQDAHLVGLEVGQSLGAGVLALVAVNRGSRQAVLFQILGQTVGAVLGPGEDQHLLPGTLGDQVREQSALVAGSHAEHALLDTLDGGVRRRDLDALGIVQQLAGEVGDVLGEGRREQQVLALGRQLGEDLLDVMDEAHVEHAVGFVEDENFHVRQVDGFLVG